METVFNYSVYGEYSLEKCLSRFLSVDYLAKSNADRQVMVWGISSNP